MALTNLNKENARLVSTSTALFFFFFSLVIHSFLFRLSFRSKNSKVRQCSTRKCALKLAMQQILMNGLVMILCITKLLVEKSGKEKKKNIINHAKDIRWNFVIFLSFS